MAAAGFDTTPSLDQAEARLERRREGTVKYKEGREAGYMASVGFSQPRM